MVNQVSGAITRPMSLLCPDGAFALVLRRGAAASQSCLPTGGADLLSRYDSETARIQAPHFLNNEESKVESLELEGANGVEH